MRSVEYVKLYPWSGGKNSAIDPIILDPQQLQEADNIVFSTSGARKKRPAYDHINTAAITTAGTGSNDVIFFKDYWANVSNAKRQRLVAVTENGEVWRSADSGATWNEFTSAALAVTHGQITAEVFNEDLILGFRQSGVPYVWDNQNTAVNIVAATATSGTYPTGWILRKHRNRLWVSGNQAARDRVYFSGFTAGVPDHRQWSSSNSAGFIDVMPGDGDPVGVTAIFPELRRAGLYVAKRTKIYFIDTSAEDSADWTINEVSDGIGCISHNSAVSIDQTDVVFASDRGIHSLEQVISGTNVVEGKYLSADIFPDWQDDVNAAARNTYSAVWYAPLNSYLIGVKRAGVSTYETIYGYNVETGGWYVWKNIPCNYLSTRYTSSTGAFDLILCADSGFINTLDEDLTADLDTTAIQTLIQSAVIYPSEPVPGEKHFTNLVFVFRAHDDTSFRVFYTIAGETNSVNVQQDFAEGNILGTTLLGSGFILGSGVGNGITPVFVPIKGVGHSIEVQIQHTDPNGTIELFGMWVEYYRASESQARRVA